MFLRLTALLLAPDEYSELEPFDKYFSARIAKVTMPGSGLEHQKTAEIPAELAGEDMPDETGAFAGDQKIQAAKAGC